MQPREKGEALFSRGPPEANLGTWSKKKNALAPHAKIRRGGGEGTAVHGRTLIASKNTVLRKKRGGGFLGERGVSTLIAGGEGSGLRTGKTQFHCPLVSEAG